jgi:hypothetical protein
MGTLSRLYDFTPETVIRSQEVDDEYNQIINEINGNIDTVNIKDLAITAAKIASLAVNTGHLADGAVINDKLGTNSVATSNIQDLAIVNAKLALLSVQTGNIIDDAITADKVANLAITSVKIAAGAVTNSKLATGAVSNDKIQNDSVSGAKIIDGSIDETELANDSVSSDKIQNNAVIGSKLPSSVVTTDKINNLAITTAKIAAGAVTNNEIGANAVTDVKILNNSIGSSKLQNGAVITDKVTNLAITSVKIADLNVTTGKLANGAVTNDKIATDAVTTIKIANLNVTNAKLENGVGSTSGITKAKMMPTEIDPVIVLLADAVGTNIRNTNAKTRIVGIDTVVKDTNGIYLNNGIKITADTEGDYFVSLHTSLTQGQLEGEVFMLAIQVNGADYITQVFTVERDWNDFGGYTGYFSLYHTVAISGIVPNLVEDDEVFFVGILHSDSAHSYRTQLTTVSDEWTGWPYLPPYGSIATFSRHTFSQP